MTDKDLLDRGYTEYPPVKPFHSDGIEKFFQKCFKDEKGEKYYIDVNKWEGWTHPRTGQEFPPAYEYSVQLYHKDTHNAIDMLFSASWDVESVEKHIELLFSSGNYDYYEMYE